MRGKSTHLRAHKETNILNMHADHFKMNDEEKLVLQKMRDLFKQLRGLPHQERKDSLITLSLIMNSIFKTNEENKLIPAIEKKCQQLKNRQVHFEGFMNSVRYDVYKEVTLYDFKINNEKIPFLLSSQLLLVPFFDIDQTSRHANLEIVSIEDELHLQKLYISGKGILRYRKGEELVVDLRRPYGLSLL